MKAACAGGTGMSDLQPRPRRRRLARRPDVPAPHRDARGVARSATRPSFTLGRRSTLIFGHEPGGGSQATLPGPGRPCRADRRPTPEDALLPRRGDRGDRGEFLHPRAADGRRELHVAQPQRRADRQGLRRSSPGTTSPGSRVVDFTDPANAKEIAYADPGAARRPEPAGRASSSAATGRPTGTTAASTSPTSRVGSSSGTSATARSRGPGSSAISTRRRRSSPSTEQSRPAD